MHQCQQSPLCLRSSVVVNATIAVRCVCYVLCCCAIGCDSGFVMSGSVVDKLGNPVSDVTVGATAKNDVKFQPIRAVTDKQGAFYMEMMGLTQETRDVSISVQKDGFVPVNIQLPLGLQTDGVVFELVPLDADSPSLP